MSQKLPVVEETTQFNEDFIKSYNKDSDIGYFLEFDLQCQKKLQCQLKCQCKKLHELNNYYIWKIKTNTELWLSIEKVHIVITLNQKALPKP